MYYWLKKENFIVLLQQYLLTTFNTTLCYWPYSQTSSGHIPRKPNISKMLSESYYLMIIFGVSNIGAMQRGCMKNAALVLDQKTFFFPRKSILKFTQKKLFCQNCVCKRVGPRFDAGFCRLYWVSCGL